MRESRVGVWISVATLVALLLGLAPAYLIFFDKPDLVYETQIVNIPLPRDLLGQLPDTLAIVTVQNIGRKPSTDLKGSLTVGGELVEYQVKGPNAAYGQVSHSQSGSQILFECSRLASGEYPIRISAWYRGANADPDIGVSDVRGAARKVNSIAAANTRYRVAGSGVLGLFVGLLGSFVASWAAYRTYATRKSISNAARRIEEISERVRSNADQIGTVQEPGPRGEQ
jgi:hypothetical protein